MLRPHFFAICALALLQACSSSSTDSPGPTPPKAPNKFRVKFETTKGDFVVDALREWSPIGADRFHELVQANFFEGAKFFRIVPGFVVQFGLKGVPEIDNKWEQAVIEDDPPSGISNTLGTISFATRGPKSRTSQLFVNIGNNGRLDSMGFTPFGRVTEGMQVVMSLHSAYGEAPDQGRIRTEGNAYLERQFPQLDGIKKASIIN